MAGKGVVRKGYGANVRQVYFCNFIIEPYLKDPVHSKFIDEAVLDKYWDVGGVR